jgi:hypothetical protein
MARCRSGSHQVRFAVTGEVGRPGVVAKLKAMRGKGKCYSDDIVRLAARAESG